MCKLQENLQKLRRSEGQTDLNSLDPFGHGQGSSKHINVTENTYSFNC